LFYLFNEKIKTCEKKKKKKKKIFVFDLCLDFGGGARPIGRKFFEMTRQHSMYTHTHAAVACKGQMVIIV
jgi:hypothetical protein